MGETLLLLAVVNIHYSSYIKAWWWL